MKSPLQLWREWLCRRYGHLRRIGRPSSSKVGWTVYECPRCKDDTIRKTPAKSTTTKG